ELISEAVATGHECADLGAILLERGRFFLNLGVAILEIGLRRLDSSVHELELILNLGERVKDLRSSPLEISLVSTQKREFAVNLLLDLPGFGQERGDLESSVLDLAIELRDLVLELMQSSVCVCIEPRHRRPQHDEDDRYQHDQDNQHFPRGRHQTSPA